jgi:hypothetical protein
MWSGFGGIKSTSTKAQMVMRELHVKYHQEVILQLKSRRGRYWMWDISGQLCTKM